MLTRRHFVKSAAAATTGIVFCGCGLHPAAHAQEAGARRLPVTLNGRRIKTIDVHSHCFFREAASLSGDPMPRLTPPINGASEAFIGLTTRPTAAAAKGV